ncbi:MULTISPECIES: helix-turn-helix domain-containing protein [Sporomusa]|jgi:transcriptional regulator with XRE-family HTH domain|uniref:helix-turn-helix domain-containing protein n=1 Tax=Sporomusa TaxID=2375 RepID=UPI00202DE3D9|nr:helix-turn-helix transcriptional regulator [Sporomusa sphaeroides]MCM0761574.1 helix-turn-helix domain-containing protein [Sporomusa sphaeroides DSM 2875]HML31954.1 helix-turn-helix transcriptional regulator [Sporomusa sphaeroides]
MRGKHLAKYREIGRKVAFYRKLRNLTQESLSEQIDKSRSYISKIEAENSEMEFSLDILFDIADALKVDVAAFFNPIDVEIRGRYLKR